MNSRTFPAFTFLQNCLGTKRWLVLFLAILLVTLCAPAQATSLQTTTGTVANKTIPKLSFIANCIKLFKFLASDKSKNHTIGERNPKFLSDYDFLDQARYETDFGKVRSYYDPELKTRVYFGTGGHPNAAGEIPKTDPDAKALVIYFHGSGTENGSGANFNYKANDLLSLGYQPMSFDYPFHNDGSLQRELAFAGPFMKWVDKLIEKHRNPGQKVILVGHSYGVNVIAEYISRNPNKVDGAVMLSPAGFTKELRTWAREKTEPMLRNFPHFEFNELGSRWAGLVNRGFSWDKDRPWWKFWRRKKDPDPTKVNPKLKVRVLTGEKEEFIPGPLRADGMPADGPRTFDVCAKMKEFFAHIDCTTEPGVGHLIFRAKDDYGRDLVLREILGTNGEDASEAVKLKAAWSKNNQIPETEKILLRYELDPFFKEWIDRGPSRDRLLEIFQKKDTAEARALNAEFKEVEIRRRDQVFKNILNAENTAPDFYVANKDAIEKLKAGDDYRSAIFSKFLAYLDEQPESVRNAFQGDESVFGGAIESKIADQPPRGPPPSNVGQEPVPGLHDFPPKSLELKADSVSLNAIAWENFLSDYDLGLLVKAEPLFHLTPEERLKKVAAIRARLLENLEAHKKELAAAPSKGKKAALSSAFFLSLKDDPEMKAWAAWELLMFLKTAEKPAQPKALQAWLQQVAADPKKFLNPLADENSLWQAMKEAALPLRKAAENPEIFSNELPKASSGTN